MLIFQGVTLGNRMSGSASRPGGSPVIGDGVTLGAGAKVLGPVEIGAAIVIGANSVVTMSIPSSSVAAAPSPDRPLDDANLTAPVRQPW